MRRPILLTGVPANHFTVGTRAILSKRLRSAGFLVLYTACHGRQAWLDWCASSQLRNWRWPARGLVGSDASAWATAGASTAQESAAAMIEARARGPNGRASMVMGSSPHFGALTPRRGPGRVSEVPVRL